MALETLKILNGLAPPVLSNLVQKQDHQYDFRYTNTGSTGKIIKVP